MKKRYFFFVYNFTCDGGFVGNGNVTFIANGLPSKEDITKLADREIEKKYPLRFDNKSIVITGWQEMTKKDYESFTVHSRLPDL